MARAMKKFSAGGAQGKYDRRMADIKKDFAKDSAGKSGRALEVLEAKRAQRIADAEDDRAKRTGADRTATRKAEYDAEQRLSRTRKFGADKPVAAAEPAKTTAPAPAAETVKAKPQSFGAAFKEARSRLGAGKTFTFNGKSYTTNIAGEGRKAPAAAAKTPAAADAAKPTPTSGPSTRAQLETGRAAFRRQTAEKQAELGREANRAAMRRNAAGKTQLVGPASGQEARIRAAQKTMAAVKPVDDKAAKLSRLKVAAEAPGATQFAKDRYKYAVSSGMYAKGGAVKKKETTMKYRSGGSTPPKPTAADRAADAKFRKSIKNLKPTPEQAAAIGRANRSSGYAKGGKVKKMAVGGMAPNTAGGTVTRATPGNTLTGVPSPSAPAANTAARATTPSPAANTAPPATAARATTPPPAATATAPAPYKPVTPLQNVQNFIDRKYSSATPNRDASAKINTTTGVSTPAKFDRNQSLRDFNSVARTFLNQGVSNKELIQAQGQLRKLQMDNTSTPAQHQAAMQQIIARMNSLVPKKAAKGGSMKATKKFAAGGLTSGHKAANGVAKKGLTKGKQVKMNKGGACYAKGGSVRGIDGIATKGKTRCKGARK